MRPRVPDYGPSSSRYMVSSTHSGECREFRTAFNELLTPSFHPFNTQTRAGVYRAYMRSLQCEGTLLLCHCGHSIYCKVRREGERLGFLAFLDAKEVSETYGEQVSCCPGCDAQLDHHLLLQAVR